jgi:CheY-like chemotaxis protein
VVLVADPEIEQGKSTASALAQWGFQPALVHDGVEAILAIQRLLPRAIVIDAALPKMFGFQICEIVKRNESLRDIHVVLVGAIHDRTRYRRPPEEIYGADAYIERQELPESLRSILEDFGLLSSTPQPQPVSVAAATPLAPPAAAPTSEAAPAPATAPAPPMAPAPPIEPARAMAPAPALEPAPPTAPAPAIEPAPPMAPAPAIEPAPATEPAPVMAPAVAPIPAAEVPAAPETVEPVGPTESAVMPQMPEAVAPTAPASGDSGIDEKIEQAERLARIVVSDIVLYSKDKFDAAVEAGNVLEAMQSEIAEGRSLFTTRVEPSIQKIRDFLTEELLRVAEARGKP